MCDYCNNIKPLQYAEMKGMFSEIRISETGILTIDLWSDYVELHIKYCPMCGQKLTNKLDKAQQALEDGK